MRKLRFVYTICIISAAAVLMSACEGNLFMNLDKPAVPSTSEIAGRDVSTDSGAEDFMSDVEDWMDAEVLDGDGGTSDAVVNKLAEIYSDADPDGNLSPENKQRAAVMAGEIAIKSNDQAVELQNNFTDVLGELTDSTTPDPEDLMASLLPGDLDRSSFNSMIHAYLDAHSAYDYFGSSDLDTNNDGVIDTEDEPLSLTSGEIGDITQRAVLSFLVYHSVDILNGSETDGYEDDIDELYGLVTPDTSDDPDLTGLTDKIESDSGSADQNLINILNLAGIDFN